MSNQGRKKRGLHPLLFCQTVRPDSEAFRVSLDIIAFERRLWNLGKCKPVGFLLRSRGKDPQYHISDQVGAARLSEIEDG